MFFGFDIVFDASQNAEFAFDGHIVLVGVFDDFFRQCNVFFIRQVRTVDHHAREP